MKRLAELEEERRHRLGQGKDVSDLELIIADRSLDTGGDVKTLALEGQPLLTQNGEVAEGAIVPHDQKVEEVNEDPVRPVWTSNHTTELTACLPRRSRPSTSTSGSVSASRTMSDEHTHACGVVHSRPSRRRRAGGCPHRSTPSTLSA
jgi:hypothetical protein